MYLVLCLGLFTLRRLTVKDQVHAVDWFSLLIAANRYRSSPPAALLSARRTRAARSSKGHAFCTQWADCCSAPSSVWRNYHPRHHAVVDEWDRVGFIQADL